MKILKKIFTILDRSQKIKTFWIFVLMIISMALETLSVGLIFPLLTFISNEQQIYNSSYALQIGELFGFVSINEFIYLFLILLVLAFVIKNLFLGYYAWKQADFIATITQSISKKIFKKYLESPYTFHIEKSSSVLIRNVTGEVGHFHGILSAYCQIFVEGMTVFGIFILLVLIEPFATLSVTLMILFVSGVFYYLTREVTLNYGKKRQFHEAKRIFHIQESLGSIKELILRGSELFSITSYDFHNIETARNERNYTFLRSLPKLFLETLAVFSLGVIIYLLFLKTNSLTSLIPILGVFAGAAFKIIPAFGRLLVSFQNIRFNIPVVDVIRNELQLKQRRIEEKAIETNFTKSFKLNNISYTYPKSTSQILNNVSLEIEKGKFIGIFGESGSGKSTLIDIICGLLEPSEGFIEIDKKKININSSNWQSMIGYVGQNVFLNDDTIKANIAFGVKHQKINESRIYEVLDAVKLIEHVNSLPDGIDTVVGERGSKLSGGQRQRISIARALYFNPEILILDEPTSSLDKNTEHNIMNEIYKLKPKITAVIISHNPVNLLECDKIYEMINGNINIKSNDYLDK